MASSEETLTTANKFILWLKDHCASTNGVISAVYEPQGVTATQKAILNLQNVTSKAGYVKAYGGMTGSYIEVLKAFDQGLMPTAAEKVIDLLKNTNRLYQLGPGKGKAIILLSSLPISGSEYIEKAINASDALGLSKALKDAVASILDENKAYKKQIETITEQMAQKDHRISQLNAEVSLKHRTSWT